MSTVEKFIITNLKSSVICRLSNHLQLEMKKQICMILVASLAGNIAAEAQVMTVEIGAGKEECYFQPLDVGETLIVDYQVIDTSGEYAKLDIDFKLTQPNGRPVVIEYRRGENTHEYAGGKLPNGIGIGDYKICFDNKFSVYSLKVIYFTVEIVNDETKEVEMVFNDVEHFNLEQYQMTAEEVGMQLYNINQKVRKASNLQTHMLISHSKDVNMVDRNIRRIDSMSLVLVVLIVLAGVLQAYLIKQMFNIKI